MPRISNEETLRRRLLRVVAAYNEAVAGQEATVSGVDVNVQQVRELIELIVKHCAKQEIDFTPLAAKIRLAKQPYPFQISGSTLAGVVKQWHEQHPEYSARDEVLIVLGPKLARAIPPDVGYEHRYGEVVIATNTYPVAFENGYRWVLGLLPDEPLTREEKEELRWGEKERKKKRSSQISPNEPDRNTLRKAEIRKSARAEGAAEVANLPKDAAGPVPAKEKSSKKTVEADLKSGVYPLPDTHQLVGGLIELLEVDDPESAWRSLAMGFWLGSGKHTRNMPADQFQQAAIGFFSQEHIREAVLVLKKHLQRSRFERRSEIVAVIVIAAKVDARAPVVAATSLSHLLTAYLQRQLSNALPLMVYTRLSKQRDNLSAANIYDEVARPLLEAAGPLSHFMEDAFWRRWESGAREEQGTGHGSRNKNRSRSNVRNSPRRQTKAELWKSIRNRFENETDTHPIQFVCEWLQAHDAPPEAIASLTNAIADSHHFLYPYDMWRLAQQLDHKNPAGVLHALTVGCAANGRTRDVVLTSDEVLALLPLRQLFSRTGPRGWALAARAITGPAGPQLGAALWHVNHLVPTRRALLDMATRARSVAKSSNRRATVTR